MNMLQWLFEKPKRDYFDNIKEGSTTTTERFEKASSTSKRPEVTIMNMRVGDYVTYREVDYYVRQRFMYKAGAFEWMAYQFSDSDKKNYLWLDIEEDDELTINLSKPIKLPPAINVEHLKAKKSVTIDKDVFEYDEHGYAQVKIEKEGNRWDSETVKYWDYFNADESKFLSFELWGANELEAAVGSPIKDFELEIYPGS